MIQTVEAIIDEAGKVQLLETVHLKEARRALVTILEEEPSAKVLESALLSGQSLAEDWTGTTLRCLYDPALDGIIKQSYGDAAFIVVMANAATRTTDDNALRLVE